MSRAGGLDPRDPPMGCFPAAMMVGFLVSAMIGCMWLVTHRSLPDKSASHPADIRALERECHAKGGDPVIREITNENGKPIRWTIRCKR